MKQLFTSKRFCFLAALVLLGLKAEAQQPTYRTYDGTLNNLANPLFGSAGIPLYRELPAAYGSSDPLNALGGQNRPTPRAISNKISNEAEDTHNARGMAGLFYSWGQFLDHDITLTPTNPLQSAPISLPSDEKIFSGPIPFSRSATHPGTGVTTPREQTNLQTSWVDASQVYGFNTNIANWLRSFKDGKLKVSTGNLLPFNTLSGEYDSPLDLNAPKMDDDNGRTKKTFVAGDPRAAEHPGLTSLHTVFVREHNRICDRLKSQGLTDDEIIYQKARKEVGALIQAITYGQWISSLGVELAPYSGYKPCMRPDIRNTFSTAAYRWHTMVENDIIFRDNECHGVGPSELPLKEVFFNINIVRKYDIGVLLKGLSVHRSYETDLKVNSGLRNFLFGPGSGLDLVSLNLQRGRDHGLPDYNKVRRYYTGTSVSTFTDIAGSSKTSNVPSQSLGLISSSTSNTLVADEMKALYGSVDNVDLWAGCYAEDRLSGKSVGKTVDAMLRVQLEALRDGDYYYYMHDPELANDREWIQKTTLADVIARNSSAGNFQENVFFRKRCSSDTVSNDIAHYPCSVTPQFDGWTFIGKQGSKTYYKWNGENTTFSEAVLLTRRLGGSLPEISSAVENEALKTYLAGGSTWLDLNRVGTNWQFSNTINSSTGVLVYGSTAFSTFFNWEVGEPNNLNGVEDRAEMMPSGRWRDIAASSLRPVVAEVKCEGSVVFSLSNSVVSLDARAEPNRAALDWVTNLSSSDNDYFTVQKLDTATGKFENLGIVNNTNKTNTFAHFISYDDTPTEGDNFYKIVAVLTNGTIKESEVKRVNFGKVTYVTVYPNPTDLELNIDLKGYTDNPVSIYMYNMFGQTVAVKHTDAAALNTVQMDVSNLPVGQYVIRVVSKGKKDVTKSVSVVH
jgi:hypothetical protein